MKDAEKTIGNIIDKRKVYYISSVDADGYPNTKAILRPHKRVEVIEDQGIKDQLREFSNVM